MLKICWSRSICTEITLHKEIVRQVIFQHHIITYMSVSTKSHTCHDSRRKKNWTTYYSKMQLSKDGDIKQVRQRRIQSSKISSAEIWSETDEKYYFEICFDLSLESKRKRFKIYFLLLNLDSEIWHVSTFLKLKPPPSS